MREEEAAGTASWTSRRAFEVAGEFAWRLRNRAQGNDLSQLISDTFVDEGWGPLDPAAWWDWVSSADWIAAGNAPQTGCDAIDAWMSDGRVFETPTARKVPDVESESLELTLVEGFLVMTEFAWRFSSRKERNSLENLLELLAPCADGTVDAVAWRNWTESASWVLHGNALRTCDWNDVLSVALYIFLPDGAPVPPSFFEIDPDSYDGGIHPERAQWVHLPPTRGVSDLGAELAPLLTDLQVLRAIDGVVVDVVIWLDPVGDPTGIVVDARTLAVLAPLVRDIWIEAAPYPHRERALVDEIIICAGDGEPESVSSNDASERQEWLTATVKAVAAAFVPGDLHIELVPRAGKAGLVILASMLADVVAAGRGLRLTSKG